MRLPTMLLAVSVVLVACATVSWDCPSWMSREQANREMYECKRDAMMLPRTPPSPTPRDTSGGGFSVTFDPAPFLDAANQEQMFRECMESKGFRRVVR